jgi:hypothetical protein
VVVVAAVAAAVVVAVDPTDIFITSSDGSSNAPARTCSWSPVNWLPRQPQSNSTSQFAYKFGSSEVRKFGSSDNRKFGSSDNPEKKKQKTETEIQGCIPAVSTGPTTIANTTQVGHTQPRVRHGLLLWWL